MVERKGSKRTIEGMNLERKHSEKYKEWWLDKKIDTGYFKNYPISKDTITGIAKKVEYIGNSMCGVVEITLDNGFCYTVGGGSSYRPCKDDVKCVL